MPQQDSVARMLPEAATKEFLLEEQKQRRLELSHLIKSIENDQRNAVVLTGAIWAWLLTNADKVSGPANLIVAVLPALVIAFLFYRYRGLSQAIQLVAEYTRRLELVFELPDGLGWETHVLHLRDDGRWPGSLGKRARVLWASLVILNSVIGVVYYFR
jgi:hypothetical protein